MRGKTLGIIIVAVLALFFTIWCLIDATYYLALFGAFVFGCMVYNLVSIKRKD